MDTITHGIAGALIGKAFFEGEDLFTRRAMSRARIVTIAATAGAMFPDADAIREILSRNELLILTWHRGPTHSLVMLPVFAVLLAWLTRWVARRFGHEEPGFLVLFAIYGLALASHILLDLITSFGTMIWSPVKWTRPAWDLVFIIDFTFTAVLLLPQVAAALYSRREGIARRALRAWMFFLLCVMVIWRLAAAVDFPFSAAYVAVAGAVLAALFFLPGYRGYGYTVERRTWCRGGVLCFAGYLVLAAVAHRAALGRVRQFALEEKLEVQSLGAMPLPPSLWRWDGLVLTARGVYEMRIDLAERRHSSNPSSFSDGQEAPEPVVYHIYPSAPENASIAAARELPEVKTFLWFARFPVVRFWKEGDQSVVELVDLRFARAGRRPSAFTYRARFGADGRVVSKGWLRN
jgi:membrane-bound metal-dependent hydrolase YbcI (DUF457 family)